MATPTPACMAYGGNTEGGACDANKSCDATLNLKCDTTHGVCIFDSPGTLGSPCKTDANCSSSFPGLKCGDKNTSGVGQCECTTDSSVFDLCDTGKICVQTSTTPGGSCWPPPPFPTVTPPIGQGSNTCKINQGACGPGIQSKFNLPSDFAALCGNITSGVVGQPPTPQGGQRPPAGCKDASKWTDDQANGYTDICFYTKAV